MANQRLAVFTRAARMADAVTTAAPFLRLKRFPGENGVRPPELERLPPPSGAGAGSASVAMQAARLAVVTYPDTPFIEALAMNVPTIGFWDPAEWEMLPEAALLYAGLESAGVVIADPRRAAARIDELYPDPASWWQSSQVQAARRAYLDHFAPKREWFSDWSRALSAFRDGTRVEVTLRAAAADDAERLFEWRNHPEIWRLGSAGRTVERDEHERWFAETLQSGERRQFIVEIDGRPAGQVRFERAAGGAAEISVYMLPESQGSGHGIAAIRQGTAAIMDTWGLDRVIACVRDDNPRGRSAFLKSGFELVQQPSHCPDNHSELVFKRPDPA